MRVKTNVNEQIAALASQRLTMAELCARLEASESVVAASLVRWLRLTGQTDVAAWLNPAVQAQIDARLAGEAPLTMTQLAEELAVPLWAIQLAVAARWNAAHPLAALAEVPRTAAGEPDLTAMLAARWTVPELVRATGLHPATLEMHVAAFLAAQANPDAAPWLSDAEVAQVSALLDGPGAYHALRRAQARGETTRGKVAIVRALRGQWQPVAKGERVATPERHGRPWSRAEDLVVRSGCETATPLPGLATALARSAVAIRTRALHLGVLTEASDHPWLAA